MENGQSIYDNKIFTDFADTSLGSENTISRAIGPEQLVLC